MTTSQATLRTVSIQHAPSNAALFAGVECGVRLEATQAAWMRQTFAQNVHRLRPARTATDAPVLKLALPANDNMAPWTP